MKRLITLIIVCMTLAGCISLSKHRLGLMPTPAKYHRTVFFDSTPVATVNSNPIITEDSSIETTLSEDAVMLEEDAPPPQEELKVGSGRTMSNPYEDTNFRQEAKKTARKSASAGKSLPTASITTSYAGSSSTETGKIAYHIPDTMVSFKDYSVVVRIANTKDTNITKGIVSPTTAVIRISSRMEVRLQNGQPDSAFQIRTINDGIQMVDSISYTEWKFSVKPLRSGKSSLVLVVSIINGNDVKQTVYTDDVKVISNPIGWSERFWDSEYKWLFTTFLIPVFIYFWKKKRENEQK